MCGKVIKKDELPKEWMFESRYCSLKCNREYVKKRYHKNIEESRRKKREYKKKRYYKNIEESRRKVRERNHKNRKRWRGEGRCPSCGNEMPPGNIWDKVTCPECVERRKNYYHHGMAVTDDSLRNGYIRPR